MRFYNWLKERKPIKQDKKHTEPKLGRTIGRWGQGRGLSKTRSSMGTPDVVRATDQRSQIYKN